MISLLRKLLRIPLLLFWFIGVSAVCRLVNHGRGAPRRALGWTFVWGICATFTCYFGGMILAMIINSKGIKLKKFWRTLFVTVVNAGSEINLSPRKAASR